MSPLMPEKQSKYAIFIAARDPVPLRVFKPVRTQNTTNLKNENE
jgi:hypothetical protein